mmetsp:Transcript_6774/g.16838  ORF Transcript_6774/g.16838 Transcript_6774/m.16838 type:complete len:415 (-) Transcript_6774:500-1744(-)
MHHALGFHRRLVCRGTYELGSAAFADDGGLFHVGCSGHGALDERRAGAPGRAGCNGFRGHGVEPRLQPLLYVPLRRTTIRGLAAATEHRHPRALHRPHRHRQRDADSHRFLRHDRPSRGKLTRRWHSDGCRDARLRHYQRLSHAGGVARCSKLLDGSFGNVRAKVQRDGSLLVLRQLHREPGPVGHVHGPPTAQAEYECVGTCDASGGDFTCRRDGLHASVDGTPALGPTAPQHHCGPLRSVADGHPGDLCLAPHREKLSSGPPRPLQCGDHCPRAPSEVGRGRQWRRARRLGHCVSRGETPPYRARRAVPWFEPEGSQFNGDRGGGHTAATRHGRPHCGRCCQGHPGGCHDDGRGPGRRRGQRGEVPWCWQRGCVAGRRPRGVRVKKYRARHKIGCCCGRGGFAQRRYRARWG